MKKIIKIGTPFFFFILMFVSLPVDLQAQMFSIDDPEPEREGRIGRFTIVGLSLEMGEFIYEGEGAQEFQRLDFDSSLLRFRLESPGLDLSLAFGGSLTGMDQTSAVNVNGRIYNQLPLKWTNNFRLSIPIQLTTDFLQVRKNSSDAEFLQSSLVFGSGLTSVFDLGDRIRFNLHATPNYGFSFSQGNLFGGSLFRFDAKSMLMIKNLIGQSALAIGYHFDMRQYRIEENLNDYDYIAHSVTLGITF